MATLGAEPLRGQSVRGVVLEGGGTTPIPGAMVVVMDASGAVVARVLTGSDGAFVSTVSRPGRYRLGVERIGYEGMVTDPFDAPPEGTFQRVLVPVRPVRLAGLDVSGSRRCRVRPEVGLATATAWEEARKALEAARWADASGRFRYALLHFSRRLDDSGKRILDEDRTFLDRSGQTPYASAPAEELAAQGYTREVLGGVKSYYAPDAAVLLSDAFLDTHCMRLAGVADTMVALSFEPLDPGDRTEIQGTLWLDAATAELRRVEYRYVNLGLGRAAGDAGGVLRFVRLASGEWIVSEWHIRMPVLEKRPWGQRRRYYEDKGATVWTAADGGGRVVHRAVTATLLGSVFDSLGAPMAGVALTVEGLDAETRSGADGSFVLDHLPEGLVRVTPVAPHLDRVGLTTGDTALAAVLSRGGEARVEVRVPGVEERLTRDCPGRRPRDGTVILGRVGGGGTLPGDLVVRVSRPSPVGRFFFRGPSAPPGGVGAPPEWLKVGDSPWWEAPLDPRGLFLLCNVPDQGVIRVTVVRGDQSTGLDITVDGPEAVTLVTLDVPPAPAGAVPSPRNSSGGTPPGGGSAGPARRRGGSPPPAPPAPR